jgi:hypothetical protein
VHIESAWGLWVSVTYLALFAAANALLLVHGLQAGTARRAIVFGQPPSCSGTTTTAGYMQEEPTK